MNQQNDPSMTTMSELMLAGIAIGATILALGGGSFLVKVLSGNGKPKA